jgi:hypothetical protein
MLFLMYRHTCPCCCGRSVLLLPLLLPNTQHTLPHSMQHRNPQNPDPLTFAARLPQPPPPCPDPGPSRILTSSPTPPVVCTTFLGSGLAPDAALSLPAASAAGVAAGFGCRPQTHTEKEAESAVTADITDITVTAALEGSTAGVHALSPNILRDVALPSLPMPPSLDTPPPQSPLFHNPPPPTHTHTHKHAASKTYSNCRSGS